MARVMEIKTPLADGTLLFYSMTATEALGRLFEYEITLLSKKPDVKPEDLLGKNVTVKLELPDGGDRWFDACVTRFGLAGGIGRYFRYQLTGRPWLWLLTRTADCRIFQNKKVPDIVKEIFEKYPAAKYENRLTGEYQSWEYCVQYRETDFNFVSRLLEQEGIYYYFKHEDGKHTLVLADSYDAHEPVKGYEKCAFLPQAVDTPRRKDEVIEEWIVSKQVQPGAYVIDQYDFARPSVELESAYKDARRHSEAAHEVYDWPGEYMAIFEGGRYARTRLEELLAQHELCEGSGTTRALATGCLFKLTAHPRADQNREYLTTGAQYRLQFEGYEGLEDTGGDYRCSFTAIPSGVPFRPARITPKPIVQGPQTGVVVGPAGDEIFTDKYGRVKVKFHWDRHGKKDENASCWIRVSHPWAGANWGAIHIPRIGQEVIVDFLEGDPDSPIITGRVYNAEQMPPWELPGNKTQSGILTRSSSGGDAATANAIRFEDKKGEEQLWIHAEKNQDIEVENDETHWVGHDRTKTIDHDETNHIKHDRTETVDNDEKITIHGNRTETVAKSETVAIGASQSITVGGPRTLTVAKASAETVALAKALTIGLGYQVSVGAAMNETVAGAKVTQVGAYRTEAVALYKSTYIGKSYTLDIGSGTSVLTMKDDGKIDLVGKEIRLQTGGGSVLIKDDGKIEISGTEITIKTGGGSIKIDNGGKIEAAGTDCTMKAGAGKVHVDPGGIIEIKGPMVKINT